MALVNLIAVCQALAVFDINVPARFFDRLLVDLKQLDSPNRQKLCVRRQACLVGSYKKHKKMVITPPWPTGSLVQIEYLYLTRTPARLEIFWYALLACRTGKHSCNVEIRD